MTDQDQNEAAERLRKWLDDGESTVGGDPRPWEWLDEALAAERRVTVERIRDWADRYERSGILSYPAAQRLRAKLDEELRTADAKAAR